MKDIQDIPTNRNISRKGFTLVEILIAVSIIAIITAIALPNFTNMIAKSKLRSDVQTAMSIQNAVDLYMAENGKSPLTTAGGGEAENATNVVSTLFNGGYLKTSTVKLQTEGAKLVFNNTNRLVFVDLSGAEGLSSAIIASLSESEGVFISATPTGMTMVK